MCAHMEQAHTAATNEESSMWDRGLNKPNFSKIRDSWSTTAAQLQPKCGPVEALASPSTGIAH